MSGELLSSFEFAGIQKQEVQPSAAFLDAYNVAGSTQAGAIAEGNSRLARASAGIGATAADGAQGGSGISAWRFGLGMAGGYTGLILAEKLPMIQRAFP